MATTNLVGINSGERLTVSQLMKTPTIIPKRILNMMDQQFLVDAVLRKASDAPSGVVLYNESTPLFSNDDPAVMDEFGEIPTSGGSLGVAHTVRTVRRALGIRVSKTMINRNNTDAVNVQLAQIKNTMIRAWEDAFFSALLANASVQTMNATAAWSGAGGSIRKDVNHAKFLIKNADTDSTGNQTGKQKLGFKPDTLIISTETETDFLTSNEVTAPYIGNAATSNLLFTGKLPNKFIDLDVVTSWRLDSYMNGSAVVIERNTVGGISDERPLSATPMYGVGNGPNGGPNETWRSDITRQSAIFLDQPLAAVVISGVHA